MVKPLENLLLREKEPKKMPIEEFLEKYRKGMPGVKYEYNKGVIEKTDSHMKMKEHYLIRNLKKAFYKTPAFQNGGEMDCEMEVWTSKDQWRKPDLSFITEQQTAAAAQGAEPVPEFLIEVISKNDMAYIVKDKVHEYFRAGVKVLWHIYPHHQEVEVYRSPDEIEICRGDKICSAEPVVEGFIIKSADIFKKP